MDQRVVYLLTGPAHAARLAVSVASLRRHYDGPITVFSTQDGSHRIVARMAADKRLGVEHRVFNQVNRKKNSTFLTKVALSCELPFSVSVFLDADTLVVGEIQELFVAANRSQLAVTQFARWVTTGRTMRKRIERWRKLPQDRYDAVQYDQLIDAALQPRAAINTGVFAFWNDATVLQPWRDLCEIGWRTFICDEVALQILLPQFPHETLDCRFNCSPIYAADQQDVRIWHFHGEKHVNRPAARALWLPAFERCIQDNLGGLAEWSPGADRRLASYLAAASERATA